MSENIYRFIDGRCPEHDQQSIIRVTFAMTDEVGLDGEIQYKKESCLCALANDKGCPDTNKCPIYVYAEALE